MADLSDAGAAPTYVAPNGGAKAGDLRLVCKALEDVARGIVMASLHCKADSEGGELLAAILGRRSKLAPLVTSFRLDLNPVVPMDFAAPIAAAAIRRLNRLRSLNVVGVLRDDQGPKLFPEAVVEAFRSFPATLQHLRIESFDIDISLGLHWWARSIVKLELVGCDCWYNFLAQPPPPLLDVLVLGPRYTPDNNWDEEATDVIRMMVWAAICTRHIMLKWTEAGAADDDAREGLSDVNTWITSPLETFHLRGLPRLWEAADRQWPEVLPLLMAIARTGLDKLTLPISWDRVKMVNVFVGLAMPTVTTLCLENEVASSPVPLNLETFYLLESLLLSFTNLETLHLHGWLEDGPRAIGGTPHALLVRKHPLVFSLLALLAITTVTTVSIRHHWTGDGSHELRFWRDTGSAEWSSEVFELF
ncbi:hypothetical protein RQP46_007973 [Phenoliferia psychrophenolica]